MKAKGPGAGRHGRVRISLPSPAMVVALLALFMAGSGSALAATHYLISSTKQISPKVLKKLKGNVGPRGVTGAPGATGATGAAGAAGAPGQPGQNLTAETTLPSGQSESGAFSAASGADNGYEYEPGKTEYGWVAAGITYVQPLAAPIPDEHIKDIRGAYTGECPGPGKAARGYLCLYNSIENDVAAGYGYSESESPGEFSTPSAGAVLYWTVEEPGVPYAGGEYTVTAP
jgi:hypothetical protein